jgi:hypothetical protein
MRHSKFAIALVVSALGCSDPSPPSPVGLWLVSIVNGLTVPAPTTTGQTFVNGALSLQENESGSINYCTALPAKNTIYTLHWRFLDATHLEFAYFNTGQGQTPIDTAVVIGESMTWNAKVAEARIGSSFWRLTRASLDPVDPGYFCGVSQ